MSRETILRIAKECGFGDYKFNDNYTTCKKSDLERFAHRMMAEGVKMAAEKCDEYSEAKWEAYKLSPANHPDRANPHVEGQSDGASDCALAIRTMIKEKE